MVANTIKADCTSWPVNLVFSLNWKSHVISQLMKSCAINLSVSYFLVVLTYAEDDGIDEEILTLVFTWYSLRNATFDPQTWWCLFQLVKQEIVSMANQHCLRCPITALAET